MKRTAIIAAVCELVASCNFVPKDIAAEITEELRDELDLEVVEASNTYITKTYELDVFDRIECSFPCEIIYTQGPQSVELSIQDNIVNKIALEVKDGLLKVYSTGNLRKVNDVKLYISTMSLKAFTANGAVDFETKGDFVTEGLHILANGASDIDIEKITAGTLTLDVNGAADTEINNIDCVKLNVYIKGAGECDLSGRAKDAYVSVAGAAKVDVSDLRAETFDSSVSGLGTIERD